MTCEEILAIAARIGQGLLESGAEAYRVENSVLHVVDAYNLGECQVFSIPNYLHIDLTGKDGSTHSKMCRASSLKSVDLEQLNAWNQLCRFISETRPEAAEIWTQIAAVEQTPLYSLLMQMLAYAVGSGAFALFWGGIWLDAAAAAVIGCAVAAAMYIMQRNHHRRIYDTAARRDDHQLYARNHRRRLADGHHKTDGRALNCCQHRPGHWYCAGIDLR